MVTWWSHAKIPLLYGCFDKNQVYLRLATNSFCAMIAIQVVSDNSVKKLRDSASQANKECVGVLREDR